MATTTTAIVVRTKNGVNGQLSIIDPVTKAVTRTINTLETGNSNGFVVSPDQSFAYAVSNTEIAKVNLGSGTVSKSATAFMSYSEVAVHPSGNTVWATSYNAGTITAFDTASMSIQATTSAGFGLIGIAFSPDASKLYVARCSGSGSVLVYDSTNLALIATIPVADCPWGITPSPTGDRLFVTRYSANKVSVINTDTNTVSEEFSVGSRPTALAISPNGNQLYVVNEVGNSVSIVNLTPPVVVAPTPAMTAAYRATLDPAGGTCIDKTSRTETWTTTFVGYR